MKNSKLDTQLLIGLIIAGAGIVLAIAYEPWRPAGIVMIGIGGFLMINYFGNRKKKQTDKD